MVKSFSVVNYSSLQDVDIFCTGDIKGIGYMLKKVYRKKKLQKNRRKHDFNKYYSVCFSFSYHLLTLFKMSNNPKNIFISVSIK